MAKITEYFDSKLDLGPSAAVAYLDAWVDTRAGLNRQLMDAEGKAGADPAKLAEQEAKIRDAAGKLARKKAEYEQAVAKGDSDLAREALRGFWQLRKEAMAQAGATTRTKIDAVVDVQMARDVSNRDLDQKLVEVKDERIAGVLDKSYDTVATNKKGTTGAGLVEGPSGLKAMVDGQLAAAGLRDKVETHPEAKAIVGRAIRAAEAAGDQEAAQALADAYGADGDTWAEYARREHPGFTEQDIREILTDINRRGSGGDADVVFGALAKLGGAGPGSVSVKEGGSVAGTPSGLDKAIADMEAAADDLQAARHAAMAAGTAAFRPRPNWMITNPNQYTDTRDLSALRLWGRHEAPYVEEVAGELQRQAWSPVRTRASRAQETISERGGLSVETAPEYDPALFTGITLPSGEELATALTGTIRDEDGWSYKPREDGSIEIVTAPAGSKAAGKVLKKGDKGYDAIADKVATSTFGGAGLLFDGAAERARAGDFAGAVKAARAVKREDQVDVLGEALVKAARGERPLPPGLPPEIQERVDALSRLSPRNRDKGLERLGEAVLFANDTELVRPGAAPSERDNFRAREKAADAVEAREVKALRVGPEAPVATSYEQGREAAREMARALGDAAPEKGAVEWIRGQLNKRGSAFDSTRSEYERGIVEEINAQVEKAAAPPSAGAKIPAAVGTMPAAVRAAPDKPLAIGGKPPGGVVKSPDIDLEAGGATVTSGVTGDFDTTEDDLLAFADEMAPAASKIGLVPAERAKTANALRRIKEEEDALRFLSEQEAE